MLDKKNSKKQTDLNSLNENSEPYNIPRPLLTLISYGLLYLLLSCIFYFFYYFVQFLASFEPKTRLKYDDVPVEQRLEQLPKRFSYFYLQAQRGFSEYLPKIKYWDFRWSRSRSIYKTFEFEIAEKNMSELSFIQQVIPRFISQGWIMLPLSEVKHRSYIFYDYDKERNFIYHADFILVDKEDNCLLVTKPVNNHKSKQYWHIHFSDTSQVCRSDTT